MGKWESLDVKKNVLRLLRDSIAAVLRVFWSTREFLFSKGVRKSVTNNVTFTCVLNHEIAFIFSFQRKCDQYWPERGTRNYGQVQVTLKETLNMSHYTVRKLVMTHKMVSYRVLTALQCRYNSKLIDCRQQVFTLRVQRVFIDDRREHKRVV